MDRDIYSVQWREMLGQRIERYKGPHDGEKVTEVLTSNGYS